MRLKSSKWIRPAQGPWRRRANIAFKPPESRTPQNRGWINEFKVRNLARALQGRWQDDIKPRRRREKKIIGPKNQKRDYENHKKETSPIEWFFRLFKNYSHTLTLRDANIRIHSNDTNNTNTNTNWYLTVFA